MNHTAFHVLSRIAHFKYPCAHLNGRCILRNYSLELNLQRCCFVTESHPHFMYGFNLSFDDRAFRKYEIAIALRRLDEDSPHRVSRFRAVGRNWLQETNPERRTGGNLTACC